MASMPPGPPPGPPQGGGGAAYSGKPPAPAGGGAPAGGPAGGPPDPKQLMQGVIQISTQIEQMLVQFAQAMPEGAQDFKAAADAIKQGIAKSMAAAQSRGGGQVSPAASPTEAGAGYSGGGIGSGARP